jgi:type IV pilus assembly protein PilX
MALVAALLLLVVVTLLGIGMFRSYGLEQRIGGNTRDKEKAFHAATAGESVAEQWLTQNNGVNAGIGSACSTVTNGNAANGIQVCSNLLQASVANVANVPWPSYVQYQLPNMSTGSTTSVYGTYSQVPGFYIAYLSSTPPGAGIYSSVYQVDAVGYGASANSVAVVESTYSVQHYKTSEPVPAGTSQPSRNVNQGGT